TPNTEIALCTVLVCPANGQSVILQLRRFQKLCIGARLKVKSPLRGRVVCIPPIIAHLNPAPLSRLSVFVILLFRDTFAVSLFARRSVLSAVRSVLVLIEFNTASLLFIMLACCWSCPLWDLETSSS